MTIFLSYDTNPLPERMKSINRRFHSKNAISTFRDNTLFGEKGNSGNGKFLQAKSDFIDKINKKYDKGYE